MVKTLLNTAAPATLTTLVNTTIYAFTGAGCGLWYADDTLAEPEVQILHRSPGTMTNFAINLSANSVNASTVFTIRKNAAAGNLTISVPTTQTGNFSDTTHNDVIAAGDKIALEIKPGAGSTGTCLLESNAVAFEATTDTVTRMAMMDSIPKTAASTTWFDNLAGFTLTSGVNTEANAKNRQRKAGTFKNICLNVGANARTTATTIKTRKNGADGTISISIAGGVTGFLEEGTVHSDSVAAGDDYCYSTLTSTGAQTLRIDSYAIDFISTAGYGQLVDGSRGGTTILEPVTRDLPLAGAMMTAAAPAVKVSDAYTFSEITCLVSLNTITATTITLFKNGSSTALSLSVGSSATGVFSDSVNTAAFAAADTALIRCVTTATAGSQSIVLRSVSLWTLISKPIQTVFIEWEES